MKYNIEIGKEYGSFKVLDEPLIKLKYGCIGYKVQCSCGNILYKKAKDLISNKNKNCVKCKPFTMTHWEGVGFVPKTFYSRILKGARERNIKVNISIEDINNLYIKQNYKCSLSNLPISFKDKNVSLDRIDSNEDYVLNNIQLVHKDINKMKNAFVEDYFIVMCGLIANKE